jgi:hypothetical protein
LQGNLSSFDEAWESVAEGDPERGPFSVWATGLSTSQLNDLRYLYSFLDRSKYVATFTDVPSCRKRFMDVADDIPGCVWSAVPLSDSTFGGLATGFFMNVGWQVWRTRRVNAPMSRLSCRCRSLSLRVVAVVPIRLALQQTLVVRAFFQCEP